MSAWRYYAQRILGGAWLDRDLLLYDVQLSWTLSGPGMLTAKVNPELAEMKALDGLLVLEEWSTAVYAEKEGEIRWGGIVKNSEEGENGERNLEVIGFSAIPKGITYAGDFRIWIPDAFDVIRIIWAHVQSDPFLNVGMTVSTNKAGHTLGDPVKGPAPIRSNYATAELHTAALAEWTNYTGEAYSLAWWNSTDCGDEIDSIVSEMEGWYIESHSWTDANKTAVTHRLTLGTAAQVRRRSDLRFVEGENIATPPLAKRDGDAYANKVIALGAGEERFMLRREKREDRPGVLRRDKVISAKDVYSYNRLDKLATDELALVKDIVYFDSFEAFDHPNAPIGSFQPGDEIRVQTHSGFQNLDRWVKITEYQTSPGENDSVGVTVTRL